MSDTALYPVPEAFAAQANLTPEKYREMYAASIADPEAFWAESQVALLRVLEHQHQLVRVVLEDFGVGGVQAVGFAALFWR